MGKITTAASSRVASSQSSQVLSYADYGSGSVSSAPQVPHNELLQLVDENGEPVPNFRYVTHVDGKVSGWGITNAQGQTSRIATGTAAKQITIAKR